MNSIAEITPSIAESVEQAEAIRTSMQMKLDEMRRAYHKAPNPSLAERKEHLKKLKRMIGDNVDAISHSITVTDRNTKPCSPSSSVPAEALTTSLKTSSHG